MRKQISLVAVTLPAVFFFSLKDVGTGAIYYCHEQNCLNTVKRCDLDIVKLINNDTLIYVHSSEHFREYEELWGKLSVINDSIYYVHCFRYLEQNATMPYYRHGEDTLTFYCDSSSINESLAIQYANGKVGYYRIRSTINRFPIDKQLFNPKEPYALISFGYKHPIVDEIVQLRIQNNTDIYFRTEDPKQHDFYIIISPSGIATLNKSSANNIAVGPHFNLGRMLMMNAFSRGRRLR